MRLKILALALAASGLALTSAAAAPGGHGAGAGLGHLTGGGGGGPMAGGGLAGSLGPGMSGQGHIGGGAPGLGPSASGGGGMAGSLGPGMGANASFGGRAASQGPLHASATGAAHASGALSGLADAQTVKTASGATVGAVSRILVDAKGMPVAVVVTQANGETIRLPASSLSLADNVVTTTSKRAAREAAETAEANPHPASIATGAFAGLAVGDSVVTAHGKTLGTISRITVSDAGTLRTVMVTTAGGKRFAVPARDVSVSGSTVTLIKATATAHG